MSETETFDCAECGRSSGNSNFHPTLYGTQHHAQHHSEAQVLALQEHNRLADAVVMMAEALIEDCDESFTLHECDHRDASDALHEAINEFKALLSDHPGVAK